MYKNAYLATDLINLAEEDEGGRNYLATTKTEDKKQTNNGPNYLCQMNYLIMTSLQGNYISTCDRQNEKSIQNLFTIQCHIYNQFTINLNFKLYIYNIIQLFNVQSIIYLHNIHLKNEAHTEDTNMNSTQSNYNDNLIYYLHLYKLLSCLLYTSPSPRDRQKSRMPSSA